MKTLTQISQLSEINGPVCLAIGYFDGVHLGHQAVIHEAVRRAHSIKAESVVLTFDPHPAKILRPGESPLLLTSLPHKLDLIKGLEADYSLVIEFTEEFARTQPEDFIRSLQSRCPLLECICVGHQWAFGHKRKGNVELISQLGSELGFHVHEVPPVCVQDELVSSTVIRQYVALGDLFSASRFLGRPYSLLGDVITGQKIGSKIGFPTANLNAYAEILPPNGVYVCWARVENQMLPAVANIGCRPTTNQPANTPQVEVHILDFSGELYGSRLEIIFKRYLRPEVKFESLTALSKQIARDVDGARKFLRLDPRSSTFRG